MKKIKSIKIKGYHRYPFLNNDVIKFNKDITLLVGDQGSGKSTTLKSLNNKFKFGENEDMVFSHFEDNVEHYLLIDFYKDSLDKKFANSMDSVGYKIGFESNFRSHGENVLPIISVLEKQKDCIILLDEPETALSIRSIDIMIKTFEKLISNNCQLIIATHNIMIMEKFYNKLFNMETLNPISYLNFVKHNKSATDFKEFRQDKAIKKTKCSMGLNCICAGVTDFYDYKCKNYIIEKGNGRAESMRRNIGSTKQILFDPEIKFAEQLNTH